MLRVYSVFIHFCLIKVTYMQTRKISQNSSDQESISFVGSRKEFKGQLGSVAYLKCSTMNQKNMSMAWVRMRDSHILTVDRETFISDRR
jgi:hypothetical protein